MAEISTISSSRSSLSASPSRNCNESPSRALRPIRTTFSCRAIDNKPSYGKPSPYKRKIQAHSAENLHRVRAGIGGPTKHRESMSGIGNNLRSHNPAGLGRSVSRSANTQDQGPSRLVGGLRRSSTYRTTGADANFNATALPSTQVDDVMISRRKRSSSSANSPSYTVDAALPTAGLSVFPTNTQFPFGRRQSAHRRTRSSFQSSTGQFPQNNDQPNSPVRVHTSPSPDVTPLSPSSPQADELPAPSLDQRLKAKTLDYGTLKRRGTGKSAPLPTVNMTVGSSETGDIVDVVGSHSRPSVVYSSVRRSSEIGGAIDGKKTMQTKAGVGGKQGKVWMADRPSNLGAPAPQSMHPESGLSKLLRYIGIRGKKKRSGKTILSSS
ncbi:hypothetical protein COEREDRAFT_78840 [Coemansia reversa NRRL 1564]|uniref:Uncharacterized protein n=1 Tax=Coemansia reversa (strain ATCC 12441 / NRRL 1564) TaxID=763665 RepID=A0A2G5BKF9_COERN|nr:hypothetical protein COEREDRAFT_78840 [Coemansia reversa NRRL 1564]|eukprot:PIA19493.1 hypothetical protein COEREDRAFT_78840 [Coemansia reversa NRRL 1564]